MIVGSPIPYLVEKTRRMALYRYEAIITNLAGSGRSIFSWSSPNEGSNINLNNHVTRTRFPTRYQDTLPRLVIKTRLLARNRGDMAAPLNQQPQPDFQRISDIFLSIGEQMRLCSNIPAIQEGATLIQSLQDVQRTINRIESRMDRMESQLDGIREDVTQLTLRVTAKYVITCWFIYRRMLTADSSEANAMVAKLNSSATRDEDSLQPLVDARNQVISPFPGTIAEANSLTGE